MFTDLAREEPKAKKNAFIKCLEYGFVPILKNVAEPDRAFCKQRLAQKLHDEEGFDMRLCGEAIGLLAAALFGEELIYQTPPSLNKDKSETLYYISYNYKESGPYYKSDIERMIANGQITEDYWIRLESSLKWEPVTMLFYFSSVLSSGSGTSGYGIPLITSDPDYTPYVENEDDEDDEDEDEDSDDEEDPFDDEEEDYDEDFDEDEDDFDE
jgi:hypothetical protein